MMTMPALFIGHGSPMNTLEVNGFTEAWRSIGLQLPKPRAFLVISAHWFIGATAVTAMARPRTIHDFYGFPPELFAFQYPAVGAPEIAEEVAECVKPTWCGLDRDQWGLDHGTSSVLAHLRPDADVPVIQLSINALKPLSYHLELGAKLAPLREREIVIIASGNVVHNLGRLLRNEPDGAFDWARRFDDAVLEQLRSDPSGILSVIEHPDFNLAVPTPEHFIPMLYIAGVAAAAGERMNPLVHGYSMGSLSMTCYGVGTEQQCQSEVGAGTLPQGIPGDQSNM
jgi:4,5-DOPA dioxygenase extradiol